MNQSCTILIVDDEPMNQLLLESILNNYNTISVSSVQKAKYVIKSNKIDLILSDYNMPFETGLELLSWIKYKKIEIPFLLITAGDISQIYEQATNLGCADIIAKPVSVNSIQQKIAKQLNVSSI